MRDVPPADFVAERPSTAERFTERQKSAPLSQKNLNADSIPAATLSGQCRNRVFVVLPAYNEAESLPLLLDRVHEVLALGDIPFTVIVVDDGSTDATASVAQEMSGRMPLELVRHPSNRGLGETLASGMRRALELAHDRDLIFTLDADNTQPPEMIPEMMILLEDGFELVVASRFRPGAKVVGVPFHRQLMSHAARWMFRMFHPIRGIRDYTSGFRGYRAALLIKGFETYGDQLISESGFAAMSDLLIKLRRFRPRACEVPLVLRYDHKPGPSKMKVARTAFKTLGLIVSRRFN